tara:strand:- start:1342 stop:2241 length:900 start_codon:yes stop_codon:yes gene_type:complete
MKALVTGGAGFIGSHLVKKLVKKKYKVIVLDNLSTGSLKNLRLVKNKIDFIKCDITKNKISSKIFRDIDYVFHLAGLSKATESIKKPSKYFRANVKGTINILNYISKIKIKKFIYSASASCYGNPKKIPTSEKDKIQNLTPYASTKWKAEKIIMEYAKKYKIPSISLRLFNVYGPGSLSSSPYSAVISVFVKQRKSNKPLTIVGDGLQTRSFVYVSDVVDGMIKAARSKVKNEIFNLGSKNSLTIISLAKLFKGRKIYIPKRLGDPRNSFSDIRKIQKILRWRPKISISKGIRALLNEK